MGQKYLIDTCTVVKYLDEVLPPKAISFMDTLVDDDCKVSFITKIELLVWNPPIAEDIRVREEFLAGSEIHYINDEIINSAIQIRKSTHIRLPDAVIAATAIHNDYVLLSTNDNDFLKVIPLGLKYMNPETASYKHM
ncbi:MAG TPA: type II toxin-antitoxin system VapC family toxin [Williamwhitmania sp.]|nr:type II toxin-antitoxin system VapC family toxin [Williamwhitmania sp.]